MKLKRKEYDEIGAVLIKKAKEIEPALTEKHLQRLFCRLYSKYLKLNKMSKIEKN